MLGAQKFVEWQWTNEDADSTPTYCILPLLHFWQIQEVQHNAAKPLFNWSGGAYARSKHSSEHILLNINGTKCFFSPSFLLQTIWFPNNWQGQQLCFSAALSYPLPITSRSRCYRHQVNCASSASQWFTLQQQQLPHQTKCACVYDFVLWGLIWADWKKVWIVSQLTTSHTNAEQSLFLPHARETGRPS